MIQIMLSSHVLKDVATIEMMSVLTDQQVLSMVAVEVIIPTLAATIIAVVIIIVVAGVMAIMMIALLDDLGAHPLKHLGKWCLLLLIQSFN